MFQPPAKQTKLEPTHTVDQLNSIGNGNAETANRSLIKNVSERQINRKEATIHVDWDGKPILLSKYDNNPSNWSNIFFGELNQCDGYRLGKIVLKLILDEPNTHVELQSEFNNANIAQHFPGLDAIRIQVADQSAVSRNVVEIRSRRHAEKYIEVKHFAYNFHRLKVPPALFGKTGKA